MTRKALFHALLFSLLLMVQTYGLWHHLDLHAHDDDDGNVCEFCVGLASLGHGLPSSISIIPSVLGLVFPLPAYQAQAFFLPSIIQYHTRAPPIT
jgi:hypothetical protein